MKTKLYVGLKREGKWFRYAEIDKVKGGSLAVLDGADKSGAARLTNLIKASVFKLYNEADEVYELKEQDYQAIKIADSWKLSREIIKKMQNIESFIFPEFFFCDVCSSPGREKYTEINEDWDELVAQGFMDEIYLEDDQESTFWVELPVGFEIPATRTFSGGLYTRIKRDHITLGNMIKIQKNNWAQESETNMICAVWDASIVEVEGMDQREFNVFVKRNTQDSFCKKYIVEQEDIDAMRDSDEENDIGYIAESRSVSCKNCHEEIGGYLDFTNFFHLLLSQKSSQERKRKLKIK